ncbi:unnamed protein product [Heterobilharzia americana]|nr:unnamed protein product [Heterobilharzia americana]
MNAVYRTILLDDGRIINEQEVGPIIVEQAKKLLEIDLTSVYGRDLIILSKSDERLGKPKECLIVNSPSAVDVQNERHSLKNSQSMIKNTHCNNNNDNNNNSVLDNLNENDIKMLNTTTEGRKRSYSSAVEDFEVKHFKLSLESAVHTPVMTTKIATMSTTSTAYTEPVCHNNSILNPYIDADNLDECNSNQNYKSPSKVNNDHSVVLNSQVLNVECDKSIHLHDTTRTSKDFENFTEPSQSFILTSQLAAIVDNQLSLVNTQASLCLGNTSVTSTSPVQSNSVNLFTIPESSVLSVSFTEKPCDLNETFTFSMFESSFTVSNNDNDPLNKITIETLRRKEEIIMHDNNDLKTLQNLMMSPITSDADVKEKREAVLPDQFETHLSTSFSVNELSLNVERSIGDLFNSSFTSDLPMNKQCIEQDLLCSQNRNSFKGFRYEASTNIPWTDSLTLNILKNSDFDDHDDAVVKDDLFSIIDVTQSYSLWKIFLDDLNQRIDEISSKRSELNYIAIQPGWLLNIKSCNNDAEDQMCSDFLECLAWKSGPAGCPATGGGRNLCTDYNLYLGGLSLSSSCLRPNVVFWINFLSQNNVNRVPVSKCLTDIHDLFLHISQLNIGLIVWDVKWWYRIVYDLFKLPTRIKFQLYDPNLANWLTNPDFGQSSLLNEARKLNADVVNVLNEVTSFAERLDPPTQFSDWLKVPNSRCSSQCPPANCLNGKQLSVLSDHVNITSAQCFLLSLWTNSTSWLSQVDHSILSSVEMPCQSLLARMESKGFNLCLDELNKCYASLLHACKQLESVAHRLAGLPFPLDSPKEISKVLFKWLHLPRVTDPSELILSKKRSQQALLLNGRKHSNNLPRATNAVLLKLANFHPLPAIIIEWRHVNGILEKIFNSLISTCRNCISTDANEPLRVSPTYDVYTATGRIVSTMPNLQAVPKDIIIEWPKLLYKTSSNNRQLWPSPFDKVLSEFPKSNEIIKPRCAFVTPAGGMLISGDFCQLELRLLAHFSKDSELLKLLSVECSSHIDQSMAPNSESDAFKKLAAHWLNIPHPNQVTDVQRQQAKQICYAILYGMGAQTLSNQLNISEQTAQKLIDSFLQTYPGVQNFITTTISSAHHEGRITTLNGHIRLLPALSSKTSLNHGMDYDYDFGFSRKQDYRNYFAVMKAERQAVNSIIQGSAAELAKLAMLAVDEALHCTQIPGYASIVLHEHDELIYEVFPESSVKQFGLLIRQTMSNVGKQCNINVPLPVKLRIGPNWSDLKQVDW